MGVTCIFSENYNEILVENRDFSYPVAFVAPVRGSPSEYCHLPFGVEKLE